MAPTDGVAVQMTVDTVPFLSGIDRAKQVLHVGFYAYIKRLGVQRCGICGRRRVCYAIEVTGSTGGLIPSDQTAQIIGTAKCAEHAGIR